MHRPIQGRLSRLPRSSSRTCRLSLVRPFLISIAITSAFIPASPAPAQEIDPNLWQPNGPVYAILATDSRIFVGGSFNYIGPATQGAAFLKKTDGRIALPIGFVDGDIYSIVSDGAGGWYIGGSFNGVSGIPRTNLAHLRSDLSVSDWNPNTQPTDGSIQDLAIGDGVIYAAGYFTTIGGINRKYVAAIDPTTGAITPWNPEVDGSVECITTDGSTVYAGGNFRYVNGFPGVERDHLAAFDAQTGNATSWNPGADGTVEVLLLHDGVLYAGGGFGTIGSIDRPFLAALDPQTGLTMSWDAQLQGGGVKALAIRGTSLYIGGSFNRVRDLHRSGVAEIDIATASPTPWNPNLIGGDYPWYEVTIWNIALGADALYLSGDFYYVDGVSSSGVGAVDLTSGLGTSWRPALPDLGAARVFQEIGEHVFVGGGFSTIGGEHCQNIAQIDSDTGAAIANGMGVDDDVLTFALAGETLYVGGEFLKAGGVTRNGMAAFDLQSGVLTEWNPLASQYTAVDDLIAGEEVIYVGGDFSSIGEHQRNGLAALNPETGAPTAWNPRGNQKAKILGVRDSTVYVAGPFTEIGGEMRSGLAALDTETGAATPWNPHAVGTTAVGLAEEDFLYVAGGYSEIGGKSNLNIAQLDYSTGAATDWSPDLPSDRIISMAISDSTLYVGGTRYVRAVYIPSALTTDWELIPDADVPIYAIAPHDSTVYLGGGYVVYPYFFYTYFAAASADTSRPIVTPPPPVVCAFCEEITMGCCPAAASIRISHRDFISWLRETVRRCLFLARGFV